MIPLDQHGTRCLNLPSTTLCPGTIVQMIDSRGNSWIGVFRGYYAGFIALSPSCDDTSTFFLNIKRINAIIIKGGCSGNTINTRGTIQDNNIQGKG